jgi:2-polyprenyl-3-methyl-5-hydroxy-6-metoxy-1,4-benzoquinol methylase
MAGFQESEMVSKKFNKRQSEAFTEKLLGILNGGALSLMISIGYRTGLFDAMSQMPPSISTQIAEAAGLNERYVREWLGAMLTGGIVTCDAQGKRFSLSAEHAVWLTRANAPNNVAVFAQYIPLLGSVEDRIVHCFKKGGGVPYSACARFHEVMAEDSGQTVVAALLDQILPLVPRLNKSLQKGIDVLDVGCGSGRALNLMAKTYPKSRFAGYDIAEEAIRVAKSEAKKLGLANLEFKQKDLTAFGLKEQYDLITAFDAIHDQARPDKVLAGIAKALRPDGVFLMQDIAASSYMHRNRNHPVGPLLYTISCLHCMSVSFAQNGAGFGAMWGREKASDMLKAVGFNEVKVKRLPHDFQNNYFIVTK